MPINQSDKIKLIAAFGAAVLTGLIFIAIREWYSPDIRYEEGSYYISGQSAITSLKIRNYGQADAEDIIITAKFNQIINDISNSDISLSTSIIKGGIGSNYVYMKISTLVPDQEAFIFFTINNVNGIEFTKNYIVNIFFKGGKAKTGKPFFFGIILIIITSLITGLIGYRIGDRWLQPRIDKIEANLKAIEPKLIRFFDYLTSLENYIKNIENIIDFSIKAKSEKISDEIFLLRLKEYMPAETKEIDKLSEIALKIFNS